MNTVRASCSGSDRCNVNPCGTGKSHSRFSTYVRSVDRRAFTEGSLMMRRSLQLSFILLLGIHSRHTHTTPVRVEAGCVRRRPRPACRSDPSCWMMPNSCPGSTQHVASVSCTSRMSPGDGNKAGLWQLELDKRRSSSLRTSQKWSWD